MNVEIGTEAKQFPEKKYINGIFVAVQVNMYPGPKEEGFKLISYPFTVFYTVTIYPAA
jgi:hypothetical protein